MNLVKLQLDTTGVDGDRYIYEQFPWNEQLFDIIVDSLEYIENQGEPVLLRKEELNIPAIKDCIKNSNGHYITLKSGGCIAIYEFDYLYFNYEKIKKYLELEKFYAYSLSELLKRIAIVENIDWEIDYFYEVEFENGVKQMLLSEIIKKGNLNKEEIIELKKDLEESGCKIKLLNNE